MEMGINEIMKLLSQEKGTLNSKELTQPYPRSRFQSQFNKQKG